MNVDVVIPFFADADRIGPTLDAVLRQNLPDGWRLNLVVVDDGTPDGGESASLLGKQYPDIQLLRLETNRGRSQACNSGVASGTAELVMVLDNDCVLAGEDVLLGHIERLGQSDVSIGSVVPNASGVWGELGSRVAADRRIAAAEGRTALLTTQHVMMRRSAFDTVGGFSVAYRHYGFEDRDLLSRLSSAGYELTHAADLVAVEHDQPNLPGYVHKARMAGKHTAAIFRSDHPDLYAMTPYHRVDVSLHAWLRPAAFLAKATLPVLIRIGDRAIGWGVVPMGLRVWVIRSLFAASFMVGTAEATRSN